MKITSTAPLRRVALTASMFSIRISLLVIGLLQAATLAHALDVIFVGNSFTHTFSEYNASAITDANAGTKWNGGVPAIFKKLATEGGYNDVNVTMEAVHGHRLRQHFDEKKAIIGKRWDWVVLQEYSTFPLSTYQSGEPWKGGNVPWFEEAVENLSKLVREHNPEVKILLYQTWARPDMVPDAFPTLDAMQAELRDTHTAAAKKVSADVAPVGDGFLRAVTDGVAYNPKDAPASPSADAVNLWSADNYHPSKAGAYLSACVFYSKILGGDPRKLPTDAGSAAAELGLNAKAADSLQDIAHAVATSSATP